MTFFYKCASDPESDNNNYYQILILCFQCVCRILKTATKI